MLGYNKFILASLAAAAVIALPGCKEETQKKETTVTAPAEPGAPATVEEKTTEETKQ